ncbi:glycosyltransferase family 39 protein [Candidatus Daviesbacteria bacterium]|nr:glycosyltransferase family 39 protein [Candidatus Daviesbacteria bacterium]
MKKRLTIFLLLFLITLVGGFLRFYHFTTNPPSLNNDEVAFGYSAYSILQTGRDENGLFMPITFPSVGDYKNPIPVYILVPFIALFGLNEFSVRLPTVLIAIISIPLFYIFFKTLSGNVKVSLIATLLLIISPWHLFYSRYVSDHLIAMTLLVLGITLFQKMLKNGGYLYALGAASSFVISMYTYYPERLFVPLLGTALLIINRKILWQRRKEFIVLALMACLLVLPLAYGTFFGPDKARASMVFITQDIEFTRYVILDHLNRGVAFSSENFLLLFFWLKRFLNYFDPGFLFTNGLNMTNVGTIGLGVMHLFEIPFLIFGIYSLLNKSRSSQLGSIYKNRALIFIWIFLALIPASLTNNETSAGRSIILLPMLLMITSLGALNLYEKVINLGSRYIKSFILTLYPIFIAIFLIRAFLIFTVHFPLQRGEAFMEGTKESVLYAIEHKDEYQEIVYDAYRGIEAPYIVNIPHMYILFYSQYDPTKFQQEVKDFPTKGAHFDKFTIRSIDWITDRSKKGTLFIGSPWSLPDKDSEHVKVLKKIYLSNGALALVIVTPK